MAEPGDPVTHAELGTLLDEKLTAALGPFQALLGGDPPDPDPDPDPDPEARFTFAEMERYAERVTKKAVKDLEGRKNPPKPASDPKVNDPPPTNDPPPPTEAKPDPAPGKKKMSERMWGSA